MLPSTIPPASVPRIHLAQLPTPFYPLDRLSQYIGGPRIWVKRDDLTGLELTGNKIRKLEYSAAEAIQQKADVLITCGGIQSNHCRATAFVAARLGIRCHLILRGREPEVRDGNTLLAALAGAQCSYYPIATWGRLKEHFRFWKEQYAAQGLSAYEIPTGASNAVGLWGYVNAASELVSDLHKHGLESCLVCCATGSGGTHVGLALGMSYFQPEVAVRGYAVCDSAAYFRIKGAEDLNNWCEKYALSLPAGPLELDVNDGYIGRGYGLADPDVYETIGLVARLEGLLLDPVYTGKAFFGMLDEIRSGRLGRFTNVVFMHTGGAFGLFPDRDTLMQDSVSISNG